MGCASSAPFMAQGPNGGLLGATKSAASGVIEAGEGALHDVGETISETVEHVKDAMANTMHNVGHKIEGAAGHLTGKGSLPESPSEEKKSAIDGLMTATDDAGKIISLHGEAAQDAVEDLGATMTQHAESMASKTTELVTNTATEADNMADELIRDTQDVADDLVSKAKDTYKDSEEDFKSKISNVYESISKETEAIKDVPTKVADVLGDSPSLSVDSLKVESVDPEIEKAMNEETVGYNITAPPTPEATVSELQQYQFADSNINGNPFETDILETTVDDKTAFGTSPARTHWEALADSIVDIPPTGLAAFDFTRIKIGNESEEPLRPETPPLTSNYVEENNNS